MSDDVVRLSMVGQILRRRRRLLVALAALGALAGALVWLLLPTSYAATSKVVLRGAASEDAVATEAQVAGSRVVVERALASLGWKPGAVPRDAVSAEVADGHVIKITATAGSPSRARQLAGRVTREYITFSAEMRTRASDTVTEALNGLREDLQRQVNELDQRIRTQASGSAGAAGLRNRRTSLLRALSDIEEQIKEAKAAPATGQVSSRVIEPATEPTNRATPTLFQSAAGGTALAPLLGAVVLVAMRLADRRLRRKSDIASALGAPVLGTVQAPSGGVPAGPELRGWRARLRWLLDADVPPAARVDRSLEGLRYRRVLAGLRGAREGQLRLLVVVAEDDTVAFATVARLAAAAGDRVVSVRTDDPQLTAAVEREVAEGGLRPADVGWEATNRASGTVLRVQAVAAAQPTIPSDSDAWGAVVVMTAGTRTGWELVAVAEACRDAVLPLRGALVVVPPGEEETVGGEPLAAAPEQPAAAQLNGHASGVKG